MILSNNGLEFIKEQEGVKLNAYQDSIGKWTIFVGLIEVNGVPVKKGDIITMEQGDKELNKQLLNYVGCVNTSVTTTITQNQFDALVSFTFNLGCGALKSSTLLKKVNANPNDLSIEKEFSKWSMAGGKQVEGLKIRRQKEADLFFK